VVWAALAACGCASAPRGPELAPEPPASAPMATAAEGASEAPVPAVATPEPADAAPTSPDAAPAPEGEATASASAVESATSELEAAPAAKTAATVEERRKEEKRRLREEGPCFEPVAAEESAIEATRRRLYQTVCGAALWFDGLFGEQRHVAAAQRASGRVELSLTESEYYGVKERTRFNARVRFPNLEERLEAFVGRDDEEDFVRDRNEGFALRSQFTDLERDDRWVLGLGYGLPGSYAQRTNFRVGAKGGREPEIFLQGRHRRNWFVGDRSLWHFRDTVFWTNRDGFGTTTALDFDHVLTPRLLMRLGSVGTFSEVTSGVDYRAVAVFYQNLSTSGRALAYELFARGETDLDVRLREYGLRTVFRRPIGGRDWLYGEVIAGYSWVREELEVDRQGSYLFGFGMELLYGRENPYSR
jgi:hypothetical protein